MVCKECRAPLPEGAVICSICGRATEDKDGAGQNLRDLASGPPEPSPNPGIFYKSGGLNRQIRETFSTHRQEFQYKEWNGSPLHLSTWNITLSSQVISVVKVTQTGQLLEALLPLPGEDPLQRTLPLQEIWGVGIRSYWRKQQLILGVLSLISLCFGAPLSFLCPILLIFWGCLSFRYEATIYLLDGDRCGFYCGKHKPIGLIAALRNYGVGVAENPQW